MTYVGFIPLRGGSKGIPRKNLRVIAGKPLCQWMLEAASASARLDEVVVSTDSPEIAGAVTAMALPKVAIVARSAASATDTASTEQAMLEYVATSRCDHLVLLQATSPLTTAADIDGAIGHFEAVQADSLVSVAPQKRFYWTLDGAGTATALNYDPVSRPRRQDCLPQHVENGAIYVSRRDGLVRTGSRLFGRMTAFVMRPETLHELDEPEDLAIIESLLLRRGPEGGEAAFAARARQVRLFVTDVDGVLTDSGMYYGEQGDELKKFNTRDGKAFELLREAGILTGIITAEKTALVARRAAKLKIDFLEQGVADKKAVLGNILRETGLSWSQVAYVGDDLGDVTVLRAVGLSACPRDAAAAAKAAAFYQCAQPGGGGVVRELAELVLAAQGAGHLPAATVAQPC